MTMQVSGDVDIQLHFLSIAVDACQRSMEDGQRRVIGRLHPFDDEIPAIALLEDVAQGMPGFEPAWRISEYGDLDLCRSPLAHNPVFFGQNETSPTIEK